jgi:hypothetical protein
LKGIGLEQEHFSEGISKMDKILLAILVNLPTDI